LNEQLLIHINNILKLYNIWWWWYHVNNYSKYYHTIFDNP